MIPGCRSARISGDPLRARSCAAIPSGDNGQLGQLRPHERQPKPGCQILRLIVTHIPNHQRCRGVNAPRAGLASSDGIPAVVVQGLVGEGKILWGFHIAVCVGMSERPNVRMSECPNGSFTTNCNLPVLLGARHRPWCFKGEPHPHCPRYMALSLPSPRTAPVIPQLASRSAKSFPTASGRPMHWFLSL